MIDISHHFRNVRGTRIHYVTAGSPIKPILILLAGFPESWYAWHKPIPLLARHYRVIALDLPGQGDSDKPSGSYDTQTIAIRVHDLLMDLGVSHYFLAAHDIGSWVAFPYAMMFGEEIERMALLDAGIPGVTLPEKLPIDTEHAWRTWHFSFHSVPDLPELLINGRERIYLDWFLRRKAASPLSFTEKDIDEYERILMRPGSLRAGLAYYRDWSKSAEQNQTLLRSGMLGVRVLAVSSDQGSIPDMAKPLKAFVCEVEGAIIKDCGHFIPEEQPRALVVHLLNFFSNIRDSQFA